MIGGILREYLGEFLGNTQEILGGILQNTKGIFREYFGKYLGNTKGNTQGILGGILRNT